MKMDLFKMAQENSSQYLRKKQQQEDLARKYSNKLNKVDRIKCFIISVIIGSVIGLVLGLVPLITVSAECTSFSKHEWINICYIARVVEAESGNQCELGKRLVADTVLNRLNNGSFGTDVKSIIDAENQYCKGINASTDTIRIVMEEYRNQTDTEVLYFRTDKYHEWASDMFVVGDHYFSK